MGVNEIIRIGDKIKKYRREKGYSQKEFANLVEIPYTTYSNYENNNREPNKKQIDKIVEALEIKVADLMGISDYLDEVESDIKRTTSFYDYLGLLGYEIGQGEHTDYQIHIKETDTYIELSSDDIELLKELEDSTNKDIKRTIELLIATKSK
ncbi:MAG: helix-turn-helix domain-containing protein [Lachnospiraceae bacterium]